MVGVTLCDEYFYYDHVPVFFGSYAGKIALDYHNVSQQPCDIHDKQLEGMFKKQSKQLRALYEMQKTTMVKVNWIQNQIRKQNENKSKELSDKVFGVSNSFLSNNL